MVSAAKSSMSSKGIENPFAVQPRRSAALRSVQVLLLAAACLSAVLAMQYGSRRWLLHRLTADMAQQPAVVQIQRLAAIAELGPAGVPVVTRQLAAADRRVAAAAYEVLRRRQTDWLQLPEAEGDAHHRLLAETLHELTGQLDEGRRGWAASLLNQTIVETVEHPSPDADVAYRAATAALSQLSLSGQAERVPEEVPSGNPHDSSIRVAQQTNALPIDLHSGPGNLGAWSMDDPTQSGSEGTDGRPASAAGDGSPAKRADENTDGAADRSGLQSVTAGSTARLQPVPDGAARSGDGSSIQRVTVPAQHLTAAPFETYTTRSVIAWLRSVQPKLRSAAEQELQRRGLSAAELQLAARLADSDVRVRLALLDELGHRSDVEPQQWLLWLAEDAERDVRLRALAILATMSDPNIQQQLAERLPEERDTAVAARIRRVLNRR